MKPKIVKGSSKTSTPYEALDDKLCGGFKRGELAIFVAGKSKQRFYPAVCHISSAIQTCSARSCIEAGECTYKPLDRDSGS